MSWYKIAKIAVLYMCMRVLKVANIKKELIAQTNCRASLVEELRALRDQLEAEKGAP